MRFTIVGVLFLIHFILRSAGESYEDGRKSEDIFFKEGLLSKWIPFRNDEIDMGGILKQFSHKIPEDLDTIIPVVIIPSFMGVRLDAQLNNKVDNHWYCYKNSDWYTLWLNQNQFYPKIFDCWMDNMALNYNSQNGTYTNPPGVSIREDDYGGVSSVAYVDDSESIGVWNTTIEILKKIGYSVGKSLRAAPYDWRVGPDAFDSQFEKLKSLIEETYKINGNQRVAIVSCSTGSPYFLLFLNNTVTQEWKDTYIHSFTSLSGMFGGSSWALSTALSLHPIFSSSLVKPADLREMLQTWGSLMWLFPTTQVFGNSVFVSTPLREYMPDNYTQMLLDADYTQAASILNNTGQFRYFSPPGVKTNCIYGYNITTLERLDFYSPSFGLYGNTTSDGDGTVLEPSLSLCDSWVSQQTAPVKVYKIPNVAHADMVQNAQALSVFINTLLDG